MHSSPYSLSLTLSFCTHAAWGLMGKWHCPDAAAFSVQEAILFQICGCWETGLMCWRQPGQWQISVPAKRTVTHHLSELSRSLPHALTLPFLLLMLPRPRSPSLAHSPSLFNNSLALSFSDTNTLILCSLFFSPTPSISQTHPLQQPALV